MSKPKLLAQATSRSVLVSAGQGRGAGTGSQCALHLALISAMEEGEKGNKETGVSQAGTTTSQPFTGTAGWRKRKRVINRFRCCCRARPKKIVTEHRQNMDPEPSQHQNEFSGTAGAFLPSSSRICGGFFMPRLMIKLEKHCDSWPMPCNRDQFRRAAI